MIITFYKISFSLVYIGTFSAVKCYRDIKVKEVLTSPQDSLDSTELEELIVRIQEGFRAVCFNCQSIPKADLSLLLSFVRKQAGCGGRGSGYFGKGLSIYPAIQIANAFLGLALSYRISSLLKSAAQASSAQASHAYFRPEVLSASPEQELDARLYSPSLSAALARLSLEERNMLILRVFEEQTYAEISEILGSVPMR